MKKVLLIELLFTTVLFSQGNWFWQNPKPQGVTILDVEVISENFMAFGSGTVLKSENEGLDWSIKANQVDLIFHGSAFLNENIGFAACEDAYFESDHGLIMKTTDGGETWTESWNNQDVYPLYGIAFADALHVTAVGQNVIVTTTNSGLTWTDHFYSGTLSSINFADANTGTAVSTNGDILRTTNAGQDWFIIISVNSSLKDVKYVNATTGFISGTGGTILKTTDGGANWFPLVTSLNETLNSISFVNQNIIVVAGNNGSILRSTNEGSNWTLQTSGTSSNLYSISFNGTTGIAAGVMGIMLRSVNGGVSWTSLYESFTDETLNAVYFTNQSAGIIVGNSGLILKTSNGGISWNQQVSGTSNNLNDVFFVNADYGIAVGSDGVILKTTDSGISWTQLISGTSSSLVSVFFVDINNGTAIGQSGPILRTTDGGTSWTGQPNPTFPIHSVFFSTPLIGWIASHNLLKTTDGGITWVVQDNISATVELNDIYFTDPSHGVAVGDEGDIYRTTNGGSDWVSVYGAGLTYLTDVDFSDANNGLTVGYDCNSCIRGIIARTTNGGATWYPQYLNLDVKPIGVSMPDSLHATVVGRAGAILRTNNGGVPVELISFTASVNDKDILLNWETATEINNKGFEIERKSSGSEYKFINFIPGNGTTTDPKIYQYVDKNVSAGIYTYRLKQVDFDGSFAYSNETKVNMNTVPDKFTLHQSYPNPFNPVTRIKFEIPTKQMVELKVYDLLGREAAVIIKEELSPGIYERDWDASGYSSGIYYYRITAGTFTETRKMILVK
jgi:photosystem II stability/assembly factor-like uncharacterized protein